MKIYNVVKIPQGLGYDQFDYEEIWQSGYTAGYESGFTDGFDVPRITWIMEDGSPIENVELPVSGGSVLVRIMPLNDNVGWGLTKRSNQQPYPVRSGTSVEDLGKGEWDYNWTTPKGYGPDTSYLKYNSCTGETFKLADPESITVSQEAPVMVYDLETGELAENRDYTKNGGTLHLSAKCADESTEWFFSYIWPGNVEGKTYEYFSHYTGLTSFTGSCSAFTVTVPPYDAQTGGADGTNVYSFFPISKGDEIEGTDEHIALQSRPGVIYAIVHSSSTFDWLYVTTDLPEFIPGNPNVPATGGVFTFTVSASTDWTANTVSLSSPAQVELSQNSGTSGTTIITATVPANELTINSQYILEFGLKNTPIQTEPPTYVSFLLFQDVPEPPAKELWIEDMEGNILDAEVITLPTTGETLSFKVVCTDETIVWNFQGVVLPGPEIFGDFTGTTVITKTLPSKEQALTAGDFYTWNELITKTADATVRPGSAIRFTFEGLEPVINFSYDVRGSASYSATTSGVVFYNTGSLFFDLFVDSNTGWTLDYVEEITGARDIDFYPVYGMGGDNAYIAPIVPHDGPRRYVFTAYFTDTTTPAGSFTFEQIENYSPNTPGDVEPIDPDEEI